MYTSVSKCMYIYACVCVCVCVLTFIVKIMRLILMLCVIYHLSALCLDNLVENNKLT